MFTNKLKLNDEKTEAMLCGSKSSLGKVSLESVQVGQASIPLSTSVRNLGLQVDSLLTMSDHVSLVVRTCNFHIRTLGRLRPLLNRQTANAVAVSLILSRLDYANSCLWGLSKQDLLRLQRVQNTAARIVARRKKRNALPLPVKNCETLPSFKKAVKTLLFPN